MIGAPPLTSLSWNLAMLASSREAPAHWSQEHTEAAVRAFLLDWSPDLVLLQELPGLVPYVETHDMVRANPRSHSGNLAVLIGHHLLDEELSWATVAGCGLVVTMPARELSVANVHLAPGRGAAGTRLAQLHAVADASPTDALVVMGDTNTRRAEEPALHALGFEAPRPPSPTWDGRRNRFNGDAGDFIAYFTRALSRGPVRISDQIIHPGRIESDGAGFHLSDHFALEATIEGVTA